MHDPVQIAQQLVDPGPRRGAHEAQLHALLVPEALRQRLVGLADLGDVGLRESHDLRPQRELGAELLELLSQRAVVGERLAVNACVEGHEVEQRPRSLDVLEEANAEADALARAGDQAGDVSDDERRPAGVAAAADGDDAQGRDQGGERVVGHARPRRGDRGDERALADVGEAEEADVGHDLQLQLDLADLARVAFFGAARGSVVRCRKVDVAAPTLAALGHDHALLVRRHVGDELTRGRVADLRADGDVLFAVLSSAAVAVAAVAVLAARALDHPRVSEVEERRHTLVADEDDARAAAAVTARRAPEGYELLAPERRRPVATVARDDLHFALIHEPHGRGSYHALVHVAGNLARSVRLTRGFNSPKRRASGAASP